MRSNYPVINIYKKKSKNSEISSQLIYGDNFKILKKFPNWIKIKNVSDNYKGYVKKKNFSNSQKNTHKVCNLFAKLYSKPSKNFIIKKKLSFGSRIKICKKKNEFCRFDNLWIKKKDLKETKYKTKDPFANIKNFVNVKYKWGNKNYKGIDCSALIQVFLNFNNKYCPRDTKDQIKYFKKKIKIKNIKKNDLIFWKGHVAVVISKKNLIHAYGPLKKVIIMPIDKTVNRIYKTANLKITGIRRPYA